MRVAIIQSETRVIGGIERSTETLLAHKGWRGVEPYVIFLRPGRLVDRVRGFFKSDRMVVLNAGRLRQLHKAIWTTLQIASQLRRWRVNAVISQGFHSQCYGGPASRLAGVKNIFWCHGLLRNGERPQNPIIRLALRLPADLVLANSYATWEDLQNYYGSRKRSTVMQPFVDLAPFLSADDGDRVRSELGLGREALVATNVSRLQVWKGQEVFVKAAALVSRRVPEARFLVVGGPTFSEERIYENGLRQLSKDLGLDGKAVFTGHRDDIPCLMAASDVFVHASTEPEPYGIVLVEAMAAAKPIIATRGGGPDEIVADGVTGFLVEPGDSQMLAERMATLLSDASLRSQMGQEGRKRVLECFSAEQRVDRLELFLEEVVNA